MVYEESLSRLIQEFKKMPSIGLKTAQRLSFYILRLEISEAQKLADAINLALNSDNYSDNGFRSQHIRPGQINSVHVSASQINNAKISTVQIQNIHMNYRSVDNGVRVVQVGPSPPDDGLNYARVTQSFVTGGATGTQTVSVAFSNAIDGDPGFSAAPILACRPGVQVNASTQVGPRNMIVASMTNTGATFCMGIHDVNGVTATFNFEFYGPA